MDGCTFTINTIMLCYVKEGTETPTKGPKGNLLHRKSVEACTSFITFKNYIEFPKVNKQ